MSAVQSTSALTNRLRHQPTVFIQCWRCSSALTKTIVKGRPHPPSANRFTCPDGASATDAKLHLLPSSNPPKKIAPINNKVGEVDLNSHELFRSRRASFAFGVALATVAPSAVYTLTGYWALQIIRGPSTGVRYHQKAKYAGEPRLVESVWLT